MELDNTSTIDDKIVNQQWSGDDCFANFLEMLHLLADIFIDTTKSTSDLVEDPIMFEAESDEWKSPESFI